MSILFVLLTFLLFVTLSYLRGRQREAALASTREDLLEVPGAPGFVSDRRFEFPRGYSFHPGHTWALDEGRGNARVGMDKLSITLLGKIERVEVVGLNRWVRQGQKLWTVRSDGFAVDMLAPVEGLVIAVNRDVLQDPTLLTKDPYGEGWIAVIQSPELETNQRNLIRETLVRPWLQTGLERLSSLTPQLAGAVAQDGGLLIYGALGQVEPEIRERMIREFFLTEPAHRRED